MAKIFLDTNYFIDAIHRNPEKEILNSLENNNIFVSTLSFHIYCYIFKIKISNTPIIEQKELFQIIEFTEDILDRALQGPTPDFEDNVQLHSAAQGECNLFLTGDKKLLAMRFFGKTHIVSPQNLK